MTEPFTVTVAREASTMSVRVSGEVDLAAEAAIVQAFTEALGADVDLAVVDFDVSAVTFIDSCGIRGLLRCRDLATRHAVEFTLTVIDGAVTRVLELAGLRDVFRLP